MPDGDADQETGVDPEATDAGESGEQDADGTDAGESGATGGQPAAEKLQSAYNRGAKETREALEGKLSDYETRVEELEAKLSDREEDDDGGEEPPSEEDREDLYTEEQVRQMKESHQSTIEELEGKLEDLQGRVEKVNRGQARNRLVEELRERGAIRPEYHARALISEGRVTYDLADDAYEVFTGDGNKMLNGEGEHASVEDLADAWVKDNPEFVQSSTREGVGYADTGDGDGGKPWKSAQEMTPEEKRRFIAEEGNEAWEEHVHASYASS